MQKNIPRETKDHSTADKEHCENDVLIFRVWSSLIIRAQAVNTIAQ